MLSYFLYNQGMQSDPKSLSAFGAGDARRSEQLSIDIAR